jgi:uncharacterized protein YdhG (YjbR/CyaY superfamily)
LGGHLDQITVKKKLNTLTMISKAKTVDEYISELPTDRVKAFTELRKVIKKNLPKGFAEGMGYGMPGFSVPHKLYPAGYHCDPKIPLPFLGMASQKNSINFYHMGIYANPKLLKWFVAEYPKHSKKKLDMGKSCIRFSKPDEIPFKLIGELCQKMTPTDWIKMYESYFVKKK